MERVELVRTWHGARWREFPQPQIAVTRLSLDSPSGIARTEAQQTQQARVIAALTREWTTVKAVANLAGVDNKQASEYLKRGVIRGQVERQRESQGRRTGGSGWVYRRAR